MSKIHLFLTNILNCRTVQMAVELKKGTVKKLSSTKSMTGKFTWSDSVCTLYGDCFAYTESVSARTQQRFTFTGHEIHVELMPRHKKSTGFGFRKGVSPHRIHLTSSDPASKEVTIACATEDEMSDWMTHICDAAKHTARLLELSIADGGKQIVEANQTDADTEALVHEMEAKVHDIDEADDKVEAAREITKTEEIAELLARVTELEEEQKELLLRRNMTPQQQRIHDLVEQMNALQQENDALKGVVRPAAKDQPPTR